MVRQYRACVVDLLGMGINMWVYITILRVQAIPILSAYFLRHPYIPHSKFEEFFIYLSPLFLCSVMIVAGGYSVL